MAQPTLGQMMRLATTNPGETDPADPATAERGPNDTNNPNANIDNSYEPAEPPVEMQDDEIINWIMSCRLEAFNARRTRMRLNNINRDAYMGIQDWSHKQKGQSTEFLPKVSVAAEQFSAFIKRSLVQFGNWFQVQISDSIKPFITDSQVRELMKCYLARMPELGQMKYRNIESVLADAGKAGLMESLIILKVYGRDCKYNKYSVEAGENILSFPSGSPTPPKLKREKATRWHLCIDLIRNEDYFPDPTGRGLYEIHEFERDYVDVVEMARAGAYDMDIVKSLRDEDFPKPLSVFEQRRPQQRGQDFAEPPAKRRRVLITEFWGTIISPEGEVYKDQCLATVANKKYLIRKPIDNPFWHDESPFIAEPLVRVPHSVLHKALYDTSSQLNFAINEIFNLILDGGIGAVWGIKQLRSGYLTDPRQAENGIAQGETLSVQQDMPEGVKVLETVAENDPGVIQAGMEVFEALTREFNAASLTNDIQLGMLPQRQVKATEIIQSNQSNDVTLSSIAMDLETNLMEVMLRKAWLTMLQHFDDLSRDDIIQAIGEKAAILMMGLSEAERFAMFAGTCSFKATGLSAILAAAEDFQKLMAFFQAASQNPVLLQSFLQAYDPNKVLKILMRQLNINPDDIAADPDRIKALPQILQQLMLFSQITGQGAAPPGGGTQDGTGGMSGAPAPAPSGPFLRAPPGSPVGAMASVNRNINPLTSLNPGG